VTADSTLENQLDHLPIVSLSWPCQRCGYVPKGDEYPACNIDENGGVTDCARCSERVQ
jgi:hypothetical protein